MPAINDWFKDFEFESEKDFPQAEAIAASPFPKSLERLWTQPQLDAYMTFLPQADLDDYPQCLLDNSGPLKRIVCSLILRAIGLPYLARLYYPFSGKVSSEERYEFFLDSACTRLSNSPIPFLCKPFSTCLYHLAGTMLLVPLQIHYSLTHISPAPWFLRRPYRFLDQVLKRAYQIQFEEKKQVRNTP